ncbi:hypothetical protein BXY66_0301 [Shimia isoporae]|uniref:Cytochrome c domain-containing protein n=1 Tax=Shimia isoporae TaxID=647720 RepID=A0A4R1NJ47_9RHOB|nr:hypothetical protein [Shimia isoporae]TCL08266.1 hypothetical protein BXY66_0301 [Shimia isoporae]
MKFKTVAAVAALFAGAVTAYAQEAEIDLRADEPRLSYEDAKVLGKELFDDTAMCSACHGEDATGGEGPAMNIDRILPGQILYNLHANAKMIGVDESFAPITPNKLYAISVYLGELAGLETSEEDLDQLFAGSKKAVQSSQEMSTYMLSRMYNFSSTTKNMWSEVRENWERKSEEGPLKQTYEVEVAGEWEAGEPVFTPEPGKTYFYEAAGVANFVAGPGLKNNQKAESSQMLVGDAQTFETIANKFTDRAMRGDIHTTFASPDGKYIYMNGAKVGEYADVMSPAALLKVDALTLDVVKALDIRGRLHHGQLFQDKYLLVDMFMSDHDGLDVFLMDPETDQVVGGISKDQLGGDTYTAWTDNKHIYVLMAPAGEHAAGFRLGIEFARGDFTNDPTFWIAKLDPETWEVVAEFPFPGIRGDWVTFDASGEHMYVTAGASALVSKMRTDTGEVVWSGVTGPGPYGAELNADESELWVADKGEMTGFYGRTITVFDANTGKQKATLLSAYMVDHVLLSPNGKEMWLTSNGEGKILIYSTETYEKIAEVPMPGSGDPHGLVWVHYDENGESRVVRDQGNFHGGIHPAKGQTLNY